MSTYRIPDAVKRVFLESIAVRDIAEPLASFDGGTAATDVLAVMNAKDYDVVGIRTSGWVDGFVRKSDLAGGNCARYRHSLDEAVVLNDAAPVLTVLRALDRAPFAFVSVLGEVGGIVTTADLQKAPVRMWLFGVVTMIELRFTELIERHCPGDSWMQILSEGRLHKARSLLHERRRRNQSLRLFDCLQFADKGKIVARHDEIRNATVFTSRKQAEEAIKKLEQLRNNLAHAQDIVTTDWDTIVKLGEFVGTQFRPGEE